MNRFWSSAYGILVFKRWIWLRLSLSASSRWSDRPQCCDVLIWILWQVIEFDDGSGSVLRIQPLRTHRDEAIYECTATNNVGEINTSAKLTVLEGKRGDCLHELLFVPNICFLFLGEKKKRAPLTFTESGDNSATFECLNLKMANRIFAKTCGLDSCGGL